MHLKEAKDEADRNKNRYLQSQSAKNEGEVILTDRERNIRELNSEVKRLTEKITDLNGQLTNQQKRVEFKQNSYQEQLKKLN